jgi:NADPH:quinone reductase-like Zn-dependent oxidoreductase
MAHGGLENLREIDVPSPAPPGPTEVLIRIRAAALNHLDLFLTEGVKGITLRFPHVVGTDGAGVVEAVGSAITSVLPGDRVAINPGISCGRCEPCEQGEDPLCREYQILGEHRSGTATELVVVPERNVARLPEGMGWPAAAAFPLSTLTAWRMLATRARLSTGETVLIWGIGGGVAMAALQIAVHLGARVIATSSDDRKLLRARELGASAGFNHAALTPEGVARETRALTGRGADVVVDTVGAPTWNASLKALAPGGRLVTCGATAGPLVSLDVRRLFWFHHGIAAGVRGDHGPGAGGAALAGGGFGGAALGGGPRLRPHGPG